MELFVLKLGSSVVADEEGQPREALLEALCGAVAQAKQEGRSVAVVTSGAIARGVAALGLSRRPRTIPQLQAASAVGQGKLFPLYDRLLGKVGLSAAQVLLTALDLHERTRYLNARQTLRTLLRWGVVPVVNENDTTASDEISFGDNDFLAAQLAVLLGARRLVLATDVDGLYTADPRWEPKAALVEEVSDLGRTLAGLEGGGRSRWGTGGMRAKLIAARIATAAGVETVVCNGLDSQAVGLALQGKGVGTRIPAAGREHSAFKLWLKYAKPSKGTVTIDEGAARALRERGSSLLPVGVVAVAGRFVAGDAVEVRTERGELVAKGIVSLSAQELEQVRGLESGRVRGLVGEAEEAIHRDHLVLA